MLRNFVRTFKIYRFNPEKSAKPYYDKFQVNIVNVVLWF